MTLIHLLSFIILNAFSVEYVVLNPVGNEFSYSKERKLNWSDFKSAAPKDNTVSESVTSIGYSFDGDKKVIVFCQFYKNESYVTIKGKTNYILNHEQRHFDITYIFAKRMVSELNKLPVLNDALIDKVYGDVLIEKDIMQDLYDSETNHSENKSEQERWNNKIDNLLNN